MSIRTPHHLELAEKVGAQAIKASGPVTDGPYEARFGRAMGPYPITVDASAHPAGLHLAFRSTAPGGICTAVGVFYTEFTRRPVTGDVLDRLHRPARRAPARVAMPALLELIADGRFDPRLLTTATCGWEDAADALLEMPVKLVVTRENLAGSS